MERKLFDKMYKYSWLQICKLNKKQVMSFLEELETCNWTYPKDENVFNNYLKRLYNIIKDEKNKS
jgi:hypothetical protein